MTPCGMDPAREQQAHATTSKLTKAERIVAIRRPKGSGRGTRKQTRSKAADAGR